MLVVDHFVDFLKCKNVMRLKPKDMSNTIWKRINCQNFFAESFKVFLVYSC